MIAAIEALALLIVLVIGVLIYRWLTHSQWFSRLVGDVTKPSPESAEEVVKDLRYAEQAAWDRAISAQQIATQEKQIAKTIQRHVRRKPTPF